MINRPKVCKDCRKEINPHACRCAGMHPGPRHHRCWTRFRQGQKADRHEKRVQATYNLKPGEYDGVYAFQGGKCAICRRATGKSRRLSVDHDHKTDKVRGLVCQPCNDMLGHMRDNQRLFRNAIQYLVTPPYRVFEWDGSTPIFYSKWAGWIGEERS